MGSKTLMILTIAVTMLAVAQKSHAYTNYEVLQSNFDNWKGWSSLDGRSHVIDFISTSFDSRTFTAECYIKSAQNTLKKANLTIQRKQVGNFGSEIVGTFGENDLGISAGETQLNLKARKLDGKFKTGREQRVTANFVANATNELTKNMMAHLEVRDWPLNDHAYCILTPKEN